MKWWPFVRAGWWLAMGCCMVAMLSAGGLVSAQSAEEAATLSPYEAAIGRGDAALKAHDTKGAREFYTEASKLEPSFPEAYTKRAVVWMSLQKYSKGIEDLNIVLNLRPNDAKTLLKRAASYLSLGLFNDAAADVTAVLAQDRTNVRAIALRKSIAGAQQAAEAGLREVRRRKEGHKIDLAGTEGQLGRALETATHSRELLMERAGLRWELSDFQGVLDDTAAVIKINGHDVEAYCLRGDALFHNGEYMNAQKHVKEGLKLDPDHRGCRGSAKLLKRFRALYEGLQGQFEASDCAGVLESAGELGKLVKGMPVYLAGVREKECMCLGREKRTDPGVRVCSEAIALNEGCVAALLARAELRLVLQEYGPATGDFNKVLQYDQRNQQANEGLRRTQRLEKQAKAKDYYKILGVGRDATTKEVRKAYRQLAMVWHPDKVPVEQKDEATVKFRDIKEAYDVLMDDNKRAMFDRGEDPMDNSPKGGSHHGGGGFPFAGFPFGGGGFNFQFHRG